MGMPGVLMTSVLEVMQMPTLIDTQDIAPISNPNNYEPAISRMKRGGVAFIVASHILQASPV